MVGRYIQSDPIGQAAGFNTYNYVEGNPFGASDHYGLSKDGEPLDLNLFSKGSSNYKVSLSPILPVEVTSLFINLYTVGAHMNPNIIEDASSCISPDNTCKTRQLYNTKSNSIYQSVDNFIKILKKNRYKEGQAIFLLGCDSGMLNKNGLKNFAQILSTKLNVMVIGVVPYSLYKEGKGWLEDGLIYANPDDPGTKYRVFHSNGQIQNIF